MELQKSIDNKTPQNIVLNSTTVKKHLIEVYGNNETSTLLLVLTILASYYVNSEKITKAKNLFFVKALESIYSWKEGKDEVKDYIKTHFKTYQEVYSNMFNIFDNNWNLNNWSSIWKVLDIIKNKLFAYENYRKETIVHGYGARLTKKARYLDEGKKMYNSNFVFPPNNYIQQLIKNLDNKLKDKQYNIYQKAAYIGTYIFMSHPFKDGNSRSSRIAMISYLNRLWKNDIKFFTFMTNFTDSLSNESYINFLKENIYSEYTKFRNQIEIDSEGNITKYISIEEYDKIIEKVAHKLYKRILSVYKTIMKEKVNIYIFTMYIQEYINIIKNTNSSDKKLRLFRWFLLRLVDSIDKGGIEYIEDFINDFSFSKKFKKSNADIQEQDYEDFFKKIKETLKNI